VLAEGISSLKKDALAAVEEGPVELCLDALCCKQEEMEMEMEMEMGMGMEMVVGLLQLRLPLKEEETQAESKSSMILKTRM
jgi:hypothetical protein